MDNYKGILISNDLPTRNTGGLEIGEERMAPGVFFKMIHNWRDGDVNAGKFKDFPIREVLPTRSVVHLMDNFLKVETNQPINDIPSFDHPFIRNETFRKILAHQRIPMTDGMIKTPNDYIFRNTQLDRNIEKFRALNSNRFITMKKLEQLNVKDTSLAILNHNPIFRLFVRGNMLNWRNTEHFLASIFNTVELIPDRSHYFIIPLAPKIFPRSRFNSISRRITVGAVEDKHSIQYCLFAQLYNWLNENCVVPSIFDKISTKYWRQMTLVFEFAGHYLFWTLDSLKALNERNKIYARVFNHFNGFIMHGIAEQAAQNNVIAEMDSVSNMTGQSVEVEQAIIKSFCEITRTPTSEVQNEDIPVTANAESEDNDAISEDDQRELEKATRLIENVSFEMGSRSTVLDLSDVDAMIDGEEPEQDDIESVEPGSSPELAEVETLPEPETIVGDVTPYYEKPEDLDKIVLPNSTQTIIKDPKGIANLGKAYTSRIDEHAAARIDNDKMLTAAQKERAKRMVHSYKDVLLNGRRVEDILHEEVNPSLDDVATVSTLPESAVPDQGMLHSSIADMDSVYMRRMHDRHVASVACSMAPQGMYLHDIEKEVTNTELTQTADYVFKYKTVSGKTHPVRFSFPIVRPDGTFMINGVRSAMSKQLAGKPIAKISPTRVSLASNYNKTIVEKLNATSHNFLGYFTDLLNQIQEEAPQALINLEYGVRSIPMDFICGNEYYELAKKYNSFTVVHQKQTARSYFYFGPIEDRKNFSVFSKTVKISESDWKKIETYEKQNNCIFVGVKVGNAPYSPATYYLDLGSRLHMVGIYQGKPFQLKASLLDMIQGATGVYKSKILTEWTDIKILDGKFPVGFLLCYRFGLLNVLRRLKVDYKIVDSHQVKDARKFASDIVIKFANRKNLIIPRYPLKTSLIVQGLAMYDTKQGALEDYDHKDIYYQLLLDKKPGAGKTNYLIGIDDTFDMFVDMLTYERLSQMGEPTTFDGLLVRATEMLTVPWHKESSAMTNHCVRSYERMTGILYNEMAAQMRDYRRQRGPSAVFSLNPNAVLQRIVQDPTVGIVEDINPIHDIKETTKLSFLGSGGRTADSFVAKDRKYPKDGIGILTESTPAAANVGIVTQASMNPTIGNIYGIIDTSTPPDQLDPTQILSVAALLVPGATQDDPKRAAMTSNQLSHVMPTAGNETLRTRTGYEKVIAHRCNDIYAFTAKNDGMVVDVNEKLKIAKIQYKDGVVESIAYDTQFGKCSDLVVEHQQQLTIKKGDKFKKHEVLRYNPQFFELDPDLPRQVNYKLGTVARVIFVENSRTFEDSNVITSRLSEKLTIAPTELRSLTLPATATIHDYRKIGEEVEISTPLVVFEKDNVTDLTGVTTDTAALDYLERMDRTSPKAKHRGEIVDITVIHACDLKDMSPSMAAMIRNYTATKDAVSKYVSDSENKYLFPGTSKVPKNSKYSGTTIDEGTVIIVYSIKEVLTSHAGDKIVIDSSLKTVTCSVLDIAPRTEKGKPVDVIFSASSESNRMVNSPDLIGITETIMIELEDRAVADWFGEGTQIKR